MSGVTLHSVLSGRSPVDSCLAKEMRGTCFRLARPRYDDRSRPEVNAAEINDAKAVLDAFGGDASTPLESVIADAGFLCEQLETASLYLSSSIARGWRSRYLRED